MDPDVPCTFQATIGGKFAPFTGLTEEDVDIDNAAGTSHGSPKMFSISVMRGEI